MLAFLSRSSFLYITLIPLFFITLLICFGRLGLQMGANKGFHHLCAGPTDLTLNDVSGAGNTLHSGVRGAQLICMAGQHSTLRAAQLFLWHTSWTWAAEVLGSSTSFD
jgi:hypothetical protein